VGPSTTEAFHSHFSGMAVDVEPESDYRAEGLLAALGDVSSQAILFPTSDRARDVLPTTLRARGAQVDVVVAYRTLVSPELRLRLEAALAARPEIVAFASPSAVEGFVSTLGERARGLPVAALGPITAAAARAAGMDVRAVATPSTLESLVSALVALLGDAAPPASP
jgi:uroporphyrinogen-III synthase